MTIEELDNRFDKIIEETNALGTIMVQIASSALTMVRDRVIETGENAEGSKYDPYSTTPMLANCSSMNVAACGTVAGSKEKRKDLKWVTIKRGGRNIKLFEIPGGYKQFRELHGKQTGFVDFSFSGRMWANIQIVSDNSEHNSGVARISAASEENQKKLAGNTKKRGPILKLSQSEISTLGKDYNTHVMQIIEKYL